MFLFINIIILNVIVNYVLNYILDIDINNMVSVFNDDEIIKYRILLRKGKMKRIILEELFHKKNISSFLAKKFKKEKSAISRIFIELTKEGLVFCETPEKDKYRVYNITQKGIDILKELEKLEE